MWWESISSFYGRTTCSSTAADSTVRAKTRRCRGTPRGGTGRDGTARGGTGRDGTARGGTGRDETARGGTGRDGTASGGTGRDETASGGTGRDGTASGGTGRDGTASGGTGRDGTASCGTKRVRPWQRSGVASLHWRPSRRARWKHWPGQTGRVEQRTADVLFKWES